MFSLSSVQTLNIRNQCCICSSNSLLCLFYLSCCVIVSSSQTDILLLIKNGMFCFLFFSSVSRDMRVYILCGQTLLQILITQLICSYSAATKDIFKSLLNQKKKKKNSLFAFCL